MKNPNILFVYPDQMRYDCMGNSGNPVLKTPGLDRMAQEGISFTNAFTSYPLCCPFRASIMTGKYTNKHGLLANHYPIDLNQKFLPMIMKENGYRTGWIGKWHLNGGKKYDYVSEEYRLGFDHFIGYSRGHNYTKCLYYKGNDKTPVRSNMYEPDIQTQQLVDFMSEAVAADQPFFASICYGLPHFPVELAPDYYRYLYCPEEIELPDTVPNDMAEAARKFRAQYYGMVANVDYQMQRILNWLEFAGVLEDTVVIFCSDHGDMAGEYGLYNKTSFYRASMQVPFIVRYPKKFKRGYKCDHMVDPSVDIMPTILEICGINIPEEVQGKSLMKLMTEGENPEHRDYVFYQIMKLAESWERIPYPERGIRTKDYLYVAKNGSPFVFFDLKNDPEEKFNKVTNPNYFDRVEEFDGKLRAVMEETGDSWELEAVFPPPDFQTHEEGAEWGENLYNSAKFEQPPKFHKTAYRS